MSNGEREMVLTVEKIFNWQPPTDSAHFQLAFYSLKSSALILQRTIAAAPAKAEMLFNYSLRITYLADENEVVLRLSHLPARKETLLLGEFVLNLDALCSRKVQFFPFGSNDRVLKIVMGDSHPQTRCPLHHSRPPGSENENFLREKQQFLQRVISSTSASSLKNDPPRSKKSFSQRARDLLGELQGVKGGKRQEESKSIEQEFNDYCYDPIAAYYTQNDRMITSKYESKLKSDSEHRLPVRPKQPQREESDSRKSSRSQKHKLQLKNLEMVAVENEYYDEPLEERKLKRRSDVYGQNNYHSRERLQRWEYY